MFVPSGDMGCLRVSLTSSSGDDDELDDASNNSYINNID